MKHRGFAISYAVVMTLIMGLRMNPHPLVLAVTFVGMLVGGELLGRSHVALERWKDRVTRPEDRDSEAVRRLKQGEWTRRGAVEYFSGVETQVTIGFACLVLGGYFWYLGWPYAAFGMGVFALTYVVFASFLRGTLPDDAP